MCARPTGDGTAFELRPDDEEQRRATFQGGHRRHLTGKPDGTFKVIFHLRLLEFKTVEFLTCITDSVQRVEILSSFCFGICSEITADLKQLSRLFLSISFMLERK